MSDISRRDYFAGQALNGLLSGLLSDGSLLGPGEVPVYSALAYQFADAMIVTGKSDATLGGTAT